MKAKICKAILNICDWKFEGGIPQEAKAVVIGAPHTSNWDFIWGKLGYLSVGVPTTILMKKEFFVFPLNYIFKSLGVIPIDRGKKMNLTDQLAEEFSKHDTFYD